MTTAVQRTRALLEALGSPHLRVPAVHVAGTNGKGSVSALLAAILLAAGYPVARFTSPHVMGYTERYWHAGREIPATELAGLMKEVEEAAARLPYEFSEFDRMTAAAFLWFSRLGVPLAIVEAGIGGAQDATNVIEAPILTIITNVSADHTEKLGQTDEAIAREKAGIIKAGRPVLTQATGRAYEEIAARARSLRAKLFLVQPASFGGELARGQRIAWGGRTWDLALDGTFQQQNAGLALSAVERLRSEGWVIPDEAVERGLKDIRWPGRMEEIVAGGRLWLLDGAHNPAGATALAASLCRRYKSREIVLIFGAMASKNTGKMLAQLAPLARSVILTCPPSERAANPEELAAGLKHPNVHVVPEPARALDLAAQTAGALGVVCGSLYLVGQVRTWLVKAEGEGTLSGAPQCAEGPRSAGD